MDFISFQDKFLKCLQNNQCLKCIHLIKNNKELINSNLSQNASSENEEIKVFVNKVNNILINKSNNFIIFKLFLFHKYFTNVLKEFRKSDILIRACKKRNIELIKWLIGIDVNLDTCDDKGKIAVMYISGIPILSPLVEKMVSKDKRCLQITDKEGRTVIFFAGKSPKTCELLIKAGIDINHKDHNGDNALIYCCRHGILESYKVFMNSSINIDAENNEGKSAVIYLIEKGKYEEFKIFKRCSIGKKYMNNNNEKIIKTLIKSMYYPENPKVHPSYYEPYYKILNFLITRNFNFNVSIDEEGNTPLMFFIMINDFCTVYKMIECNTLIDLSLRNIYGDSAFSLCLKLKNKYIVDYVFQHKTLDFIYNDKFNNNLLIYFIICNRPKLVKKIIHRNFSLLNQMNDKKETPLIIATKLGRREIVRNLLRSGAEVNHQDYLGNTAAYYAVDLLDKALIAYLTFYKSDLHIKNNRGKSTWDLIQDIHNDEIYRIIDQPALFLTYYIPNDSSKVIRLNRPQQKRKKSPRKSYSSPALARKMSKSFRTISHQLSLSRRSRNHSSSSERSHSHGHHSDTESLCSVSPIDIHSYSTKKYQNTTEFEMSDFDYPYKPLPNRNIIRLIEIDVYEFEETDLDMIKIIGSSVENYYFKIIEKTLAYYIGFVLSSVLLV